MALPAPFLPQRANNPPHNHRFQPSGNQPISAVCQYITIPIHLEGAPKRAEWLALGTAALSRLPVEYRP